MERNDGRDQYRSGIPGSAEEAREYARHLGIGVGPSGIWQPSIAPTLAAVIGAQGTNKQIKNVLRRNGIPNPGMDAAHRPNKKPFPTNGGPLRVTIDNPELYWKAQEDRPLDLKSRLAFPNIPTSMVDLAVIDYSASLKDSIHIREIVADLRGSGYSAVGQLALAHLALQYDLPIERAVIAPLDYQYLPAHPDHGYLNEEDEGTPLCPTLRYGGRLELWDLGSYEQFQKKDGAYFVVGQPIDR